MAAMKLPKSTAGARSKLEELAPTGPDITTRPVFGQPTVFVRGNMFLGTFGDLVFVRLSEKERQQALEEHGMKTFEPMAGRPMTEYVVLPPPVLADRAAARAWVAKSLAYARTLPPKLPGKKAGGAKAKRGG